MLPVTAQTITTSTEGLVAGEVKVPTKDGEMPAYRAMPATGSNFPVVLVVQEIFGVHEHIKDVCRRIAKAGYFAIAPELYARQGDASKYTDIPKLISEIVTKVTDAQVMADLDAASPTPSRAARRTPRVSASPASAGAGAVTLMYAAHNPSVKAAVAWYGPTARAYAAGDKTALDVAPPDQGRRCSASTAAPTTASPPTPWRRCSRRSRAAGNAKSEYKIYPDTPHAFNADYRPSYRKEQAEDGWAKMLAWFKLNLS